MSEITIGESESPILGGGGGGEPVIQLRPRAFLDRRFFPECQTRPWIKGGAFSFPSERHSETHDSNLGAEIKRLRVEGIAGGDLSTNHEG